jgi:hypothetical protein
MMVPQDVASWGSSECDEDLRLWLESCPPEKITVNIDSSPTLKSVAIQVGSDAEWLLCFVFNEPLLSYHIERLKACQTSIVLAGK